MKKPSMARKAWSMFWLLQGGAGRWGRIATRLAAVGVNRYRARYSLADMSSKGYIDPTVEFINIRPRLGRHVYLGEGVVVARWSGLSRMPPQSSPSEEGQRGFVELEDRVKINRDTSLEVLDGGAISVGNGTSIEQRCLLISGVEPILIGSGVQVAPCCAFFSYNHGMEPNELICRQALSSRGPIVVEDDVWLGVSVSVLSGVTIGRGAVVGAGAVVTRDVPAGAIAVGPAARVIKFRDELRR
jgi:acetyltransferase-like isoleucine patch superfamily enzyme